MSNKAWSYKAGERGVNRVRVFAHWKSGRLFIEYTELGKKCRRALRTTDKGAAKRKADEIAATVRQEGTPDANIEPYVTRWLVSLRGHVGQDTVNHYRNVLRQLIPERSSFPLSMLKPAILEPWLSAIDAKAGTKRKYHAAVSQFCKYLMNSEVLVANPMRMVKAPPVPRPRVEYLEHVDVIRLVEEQEEPYRTLSALIHGTGMEVSVAVSLTRRDIDRTVNGGYALVARGTKTAARHRRVYLDKWAIQYLEKHVALLTPDAALFPGVNRWTASDKHREACKSLGILNYTLRDARHTWAVRATRAGASPEVVRRQLGHVDTVMVNKVYAPYRPTEDEMTAWHRSADERDKQAAVA